MLPMARMLSPLPNTLISIRPALQQHGVHVEGEGGKCAGVGEHGHEQPPEDAPAQNLAQQPPFGCTRFPLPCALVQRRPYLPRVENAEHQVDGREKDEGLAPAPSIHDVLHHRNEDGARQPAPQRDMRDALPGSVSADTSGEHGKRRLVQCACLQRAQ
jgi:hypothetical protein